MGFCVPGDLFYSEVDNLLDDIESIKIHIYINTGPRQREFPRDIDQLRVIFYWICTEAMKINAPKCGFSVNYIP